MWTDASVLEALTRSPKRPTNADTRGPRVAGGHLERCGRSSIVFIMAGREDISATANAFLHVKNGNMDGLAACLTHHAPVVLARDAFGRTLLAHAVVQDDAVAATLLLEHGAQPGAVNNRGASILHEAASMGSAHVLRVLLGAEGVEVDVHDSKGGESHAARRGGGLAPKFG